MRNSFVLLIVLLSGCNNQQQDSGRKGPESKISAVPDIRPETKKQTSITGKWGIKDYYSVDKLLNYMVDSIYRSLSNSEKSAQMIMAATSEYDGIGLPFKTVLALYKNRIIGSVLFLKGKRSVFSKEINLLNTTSHSSKIFPAVFACDCEPSLFHKKFTDADSLTPASLLHNIDEVKQVATLISTEMKKMGLHWNFAPVADINENKEIINDRSFGHDNSEVIEKSVAFIQASTNNNIATSIKHFPGHGAVKGDSHKNLVYIDSSFKELDNFTSIIRQANPVSVMVGHIAVKNNSGFNTSGMPATLSKKIVTDLLKDSLGFKGIVITDAMNMGAVKNIEDADFRTVLAGNDLILIPEHIQSLHKRIMTQLNGSPETRKRISGSIKKMIRLKICLGLFTN